MLTHAKMYIQLYHFWAHFSFVHSKQSTYEKAQRFEFCRDNVIIATIERMRTNEKDLVFFILKKLVFILCITLYTLSDYKIIEQNFVSQNPYKSSALMDFGSDPRLASMNWENFVIVIQFDLEEVLPRFFPDVSWASRHLFCRIDHFQIDQIAHAGHHLTLSINQALKWQIKI